MKPDARQAFDRILSDAILQGSLTRLTLGKPSGDDPSLKNLIVRPVRLKSGDRFAFVWRHKTKDVTKNLGGKEALELLGSLIGSRFMDANLATATRGAQLETGGAKSRLRLLPAAEAPPVQGNDREKRHVLSKQAPWLRALGVTGDHGRPLTGMSDKFRQIENFAEILGHLVRGAPLPSDRPIRVFDMGCGKGYLTFAASELLGDRAMVVGIEVRPELVAFCNRVAGEENLSKRLSFQVGSIADTPAGDADILIALHACDTATDDAMARAISAGASLILVAPCCQKEVRRQLAAPPVLSPALRHGIFQERHAEFATDALRALLLEWSGYRTRVIEFISTEHTPKNLMITGVRDRAPRDPGVGAAIRELAAFYGVKQQSLARQIGFELP